MASVMRPVRLPALLLCLACTGCFTPTDQLPADTVPLETWCAGRSMDRMCRQQVACRIASPDAGCADIAANARPFSEPDPCSPSLRASLDAGTIRYDGRAAAQCLLGQRTSCDGSGAARLACDAVFLGQGSLGTSCTLDTQCAPDLWCDFTAGTCPGACQPRTSVGAVTTNAAACASDLARPLDGGTFRCLDVPRLGDACEAGLSCAGGLRCEGGRCVASVEDGAACTDSRACRPGSTCVAGRCTPFAARGERCASQFFPVHPDANSCQLGLACRAGVCGEPLREGESCREEPNRCGAGTRCDLASMRCVRVGGVGAPCDSAGACATELRCLEGTCRVLAKLGEACDVMTPCEPTRACVEGRCVSDVRECR